MSETRTTLNNSMKEAMKAKDQLQLDTVRMVLAKIKDQDIAARSTGNQDGITDGEIASLMQNMIKQRQESSKMYRDGNRPELADKEDKEISIIGTFLPKQLSDAEIQSVVEKIVASTGATSIKDMGKVMGELKANYAGQLDMAKDCPAGCPVDCSGLAVGGRDGR